MPDPALVFEEAVNGPGTHVLIIGIGCYPRLLEGAEEDSAIAEGMGQLDAPPISARKMAQWFLDNFKNADRPLASLALIISEPAIARFQHPKVAGGNGVSLPQGTIDEVCRAIVEWVGRASVHADSS